MNAVQTFFHNGAFLCDYIKSNFLVSIHKIDVLSHALIPYISTSSLASHTIKTDMSVYGDPLIAISYFEMPKPLTIRVWPEHSVFHKTFQCFHFSRQHHTPI